MPERLDDEEFADWRAGRNAVYQLAPLTTGAPRGRRRRTGGAWHPPWPYPVLAT